MRRPRAALAGLPLVVAAAVLASLSAPPTLAAQERPRRTVLAIQWGPEDFPITPLVNEGIQKGLRSDPGIEIDYFVEHLETEGFSAAAASRTLAGYIRQKYEGRRLDVVIAVADPALRFVLDHRAALFPGVPIVYSGVAFPVDGEGARIDGLTAVLRGAAYVETLKLALAVHPSTERVFVVARSPDPQVIEAIKAEFGGFAGTPGLTFVDEPSVSRLMDVVRAIPPRSVIVYIFYSDSTTPGMDSETVARLVAANASVPVYGTNERYVGSGVVGGVVRSMGETGVRLGELSLQILRGAAPADLPIEHARLVPTFDWRQLQRWGVDASRLPAASIIQFRMLTPWESYKPYIVGTIGVVVAQLVLIAGLVVQRARRRRAERTIEAREATLRSSYERSRLLAGQLIKAEEATRAGIARDLHDGVCQDLIGLSMAAASLKRSSGRIQDEQSQRALAMLHDETRSVCETLRRLSHDLHPATLQFVGLASALKAHCAEVEQRHDVHVRFEAAGDARNVRPELVVCLFRIAQESMRNAIVHGAARRLAVSLERTGEDIELTVTDEGRGFDVESMRRTSHGLGLVSMEERARGVGATVYVMSRVGQGTTIRVRGPVGPSVGQ
jgi:signal transduction histidine kinase